MPYMKVSLTHKLTDEKRSQLLNGLEKALAIIPEKAGMPLTVDLEEGKTFYTSGVKQEDFVYVDVQYCKRFRYSKKREFTIAAFDAMHEALGISKEKMFLVITERITWGAFGSYLDIFYSDTPPKLTVEE